MSPPGRLSCPARTDCESGSNVGDETELIASALDQHPYLAFVEPNNNAWDANVGGFLSIHVEKHLRANVAFAAALTLGSNGVWLGRWNQRFLDQLRYHYRWRVVARC